MDGHLFWLLNILLAIGLIFVLRILPEKVRGNRKEANEDDV